MKNHLTPIAPQLVGMKFDIKVRDQKFTLRSSAALGSLAYFYEHERKHYTFPSDWFFAIA